MNKYTAPKGFFLWKDIVKKLCSKHSFEAAGRIIHRNMTSGSWSAKRIGSLYPVQPEWIEQEEWFSGHGRKLAAHGPNQYEILIIYPHPRPLPRKKRPGEKTIKDAVTLLRRAGKENAQRVDQRKFLDDNFPDHKWTRRLAQSVFNELPVNPGPKKDRAKS